MLYQVPRTTINDGDSIASDEKSRDEHTYSTKYNTCSKGRTRVRGQSSTSYHAVIYLFIFDLALFVSLFVLENEKIRERWVSKL